jgi:hypothetical protein
VAGLMERIEQSNMAAIEMCFKIIVGTRIIFGAVVGDLILVVVKSIHGLSIQSDYRRVYE